MPAREISADGTFQSFGVRIPTPLAERLEEEAEARMVHKNLLVTAALTEFFETLEPLDDRLKKVHE